MSSLVAHIVDWESSLVEGLALRRTSFLNRLMASVTRLGDGWALLAVCVLAWLLEGHAAGRFLLAMSLALALDVPVYSFLKHAFSRPRPFHVRAVSCVTRPPDRFSFPSGHTSVAFVLLVVAAAFYSWLLVPLAALAVLIGVSRVYLGVHYPTDVFAGAILGMACGFLALWFC